MCYTNGLQFPTWRLPVKASGLSLCFIVLVRLGSLLEYECHDLVGKVGVLCILATYLLLNV